MTTPDQQAERDWREDQAHAHDVASKMLDLVDALPESVPPKVRGEIAIKAGAIAIQAIALGSERAERRGLERAAGIGDNAAPDGFFGDEAWGFSKGWDAKVEAIRALIAEGRGEGVG